MRLGGGQVVRGPCGGKGDADLNHGGHEGASEAVRHQGKADLEDRAGQDEREILQSRHRGVIKIVLLRPTVKIFFDLCHKCIINRNKRASAN